MKNNEKDLPSENIQKIYEKNPLHLLEKNNEDMNNLRTLSINQKPENKIEKIIINTPKYETKFGIIHPYSEDFFFNDYNLINTENKYNKKRAHILSEKIESNNISSNYIQKNKDYSPNKFNLKESKNIPTYKEVKKNNEEKSNKEEMSINEKAPYNLEDTYNLNFISFINNNRIKQKNEIIYNNEKLLNTLKKYWGSIFLQNYLNYFDNKEIDILLYNILPRINELMCLEYGNYFFQQLITKLNVQQKLKIYQIIEPNFINIALNKNGTHSIQSLIDVIESPNEQLELNNLLNKNMLSLFNDKNAYHIIMKIIIEIPENQRNNINLFIINNIEKIIINPYGSYCVNKYIVNNTDLNMRSLLINNIHKNIKLFFYNKCSNSILLLLLKYYEFKNCEFIFQEMLNNLKDLIIFPLSTSFVNKLIIYLKKNNSSFLNTIIWNIYKNDDLLKPLFSNKNGNKILNQLIKFSDNNQKNFISEKLDNNKN